ncbi:MAG: DUF2723 domain-containing protein [Polyangiaceae bacterium]
MEKEDRSSRIVRFGYPLLGALLVALYARTAAMGPTFSDGPEIVTGVVTLGVIHPTGYPLFTLVAHAFVKLLPLDVQPCVKVSLFNGLCAAAAAVFTAHVTRSVALLVKPGPGSERQGRPGADIAGVASGMLLGTSPLVWEQVRIPEVYPFHLLLTAWALYSIVRFEVTRKAWFLVMGGLAIGLGLAHHVTMVYMLPAGVIYTLLREPGIVYGPFAWPVVRGARLVKKGLWPRVAVDRAWVFPAVLLVGVLPAGFYYYLIWANAHTTGLTWGGVHDWDSVVFHATGRQYARFMEAKALSHYLPRIARIPDAFDKQFLAVGTVLVFPGLVAAFRRAWRAAVLLVLVFALFVFHGVYYSVGDWQAYWLPAVMAAAAFVGVGLDAALRFAAGQAEEKRLFRVLAASSAICLVASISVLAYSQANRRMPRELSRAAVPAFVVPLAVLALVGGGLAYEVRRRKLRGESLERFTPGPLVFPAIVLGSAVIPSLPAVMVRVADMDSRQVIGDSYGREIMESVPPGSMVLVQGDGYLFTLWYQSHVMNRGIDAAILDVGTLGAQWYKKYLTSHYPAPCDPLAPEFVADPAAYQDKCGSFRKRIDLGAPGVDHDGERRTRSSRRESGRRGRPSRARRSGVRRGGCRDCHGRTCGVMVGSSGGLTRASVAAGTTRSATRRTAKTACSRRTRRAWCRASAWSCGSSGWWTSTSTSGRCSSETCSRTGSAARATTRAAGAGRTTSASPATMPC